MLFYRRVQLLLFSLLICFKKENNILIGLLDQSEIFCHPIIVAPFI